MPDEAVLVQVTFTKPQKFNLAQSKLKAFAGEKLENDYQCFWKARQEYG